MSKTSEATKECVNNEQEIKPLFDRSAYFDHVEITGKYTFRTNTTKKTPTPKTKRPSQQAIRPHPIIQH